MSHKGMGTHQSAAMATDEWLTPPGIIAALGPFDLDPCAAPQPRPWPTAKAHLSRVDNGLAVPWTGRVWLNPPYGGPTVVGPWLHKMAQHGHGTALIFARTETTLFFKTVWRAASAVLFIEGRLFFHYPTGLQASANAGAPSCLVAYGKTDAEILRTCSISGHYVRLP